MFPRALRRGCLLLALAISPAFADAPPPSQPTPDPVEQIAARNAELQQRIEYYSRQLDQGRPSSAHDFFALLFLSAESAALKLPSPWNTHALRVFGLSSTFWISLLLVWLVLGIAFRTVPFALAPDNPFLLLRGRKKIRLGWSWSTVVGVQSHTQQTVREYERVEKDQYGFETRHPAGSHTVTTHYLNVFVRDSSGQEHAIQLVNTSFEVRQGHTLLSVWNERTRRYLFFYVKELDRFTVMPDAGRSFRMRPFILIPVWILGALLVDRLAPKYGLWAVGLVPLAYLMLMGVIKQLRLRKFRRKLAPVIIAAARS